MKRLRIGLPASHTDSTPHPPASSAGGDQRLRGSRLTKHLRQETRPALWRPLAVLSTLPLIAFLVSAQDKQAPPKSSASTPYYTIPLEAARKENLVKATPESLASDKKQHGYDCAMGHGKEGDGKGDVGADLKLSIHHETDSATLKE